MEQKKASIAVGSEMTKIETKDIAVLYVDDEKENLRVLDLLMRRKFKIFTAQGAEEALSVLAQNKIHVILSDEKMNGMNGSELLQVVDQKYPQVIKMLLTGDDNQLSVRNAMRSQDIFACVVKPFDRKSLGTLFIDAYQQLLQQGYITTIDN